MGSYAPDEVVAQVRALALEGYRPHSIAQRTGVPLTTTWRWLNEWKELASEQDKELFDQERRVALLSARLFEDKLEAALKDPSQTRLTEAGVSYGIARDKQFKRKELALKERDQSQLMSDLLEAIRTEASKLAEHKDVAPSRVAPETQLRSEIVPSETTHLTSLPSHETKLIAEPQEQS